MNTTQQIEWNGTPCIELCAGGYRAWIAYEIGANVIRFRDEERGMEIFRYREDNNAEHIKLPTTTTFTAFCTSVSTPLWSITQTTTAPC